MEVAVAIMVGLVMLAGAAVVVDLFGYAAIQHLKADWYNILQKLGMEEA